MFGCLSQPRTRLSILVILGTDFLKLLAFFRAIALKRKDDVWLSHWMIFGTEALSANSQDTFFFFEHKTEGISVTCHRRWMTGASVVDRGQPVHQTDAERGGEGVGRAGQQGPEFWAVEMLMHGEWPAFP